jgi:hypothetical protein
MMQTVGSLSRQDCCHAVTFGASGRSARHPFARGCRQPLPVYESQHDHHDFDFDIKLLRSVHAAEKLLHTPLVFPPSYGSMVIATGIRSW